MVAIITPPTALDRLVVGGSGSTYALNPAGTDTLPVSARFEVKGTDGGSLLPRLTTAEKDQLDNTNSTVIGGLQVYDTTLNTISTYFDNIDDWVNFSSDAPVTSVTGTANQIGSTGGTTPVISIASNPIIPGTGSITIPTGTTGQRPGVPSAGMFRYNSSTAHSEIYEAGLWTNVIPIRQINIVIPASRVITLTVPLELLPNPGAGQIYVINQMSAYLRHGLSGDFAGASALQVYYTNDNTLQPLSGDISDTFLTQAVSGMSIFNQKISPEIFNNSIVNSSISIFNPGADFTDGGNSELILTLWYSTFIFN